MQLTDNAQDMVSKITTGNYFFKVFMHLPEDNVLKCVLQRVLKSL